MGCPCPVAFPVFFGHKVRVEAMLTIDSAVQCFEVLSPPAWPRKPVEPLAFSTALTGQVRFLLAVFDQVTGPKTRAPTHLRRPRQLCNAVLSSIAYLVENGFENLTPGTLFDIPVFSGSLNASLIALSMLRDRGLIS